jgi:hypothetical protein
VLVTLLAASDDDDVGCYFVGGRKNLGTWVADRGDLLRLDPVARQELRGLAEQWSWRLRFALLIGSSLRL